MFDIHIKDVTAATPKGFGIQLGRGVIDIPKFLRTLKKTGYSGVVSFEYEQEPDDPMPGLAESVGYARGRHGRDVVACGRQVDSRRPPLPFGERGCDHPDVAFHRDAAAPWRITGAWQAWQSFPP